MKIAVASEGTIVSAHFGHCEEFQVFTVEEGTITSRENVQNPGGCFQIPVYLKSLNVGTVIAGNMGERPKSGLLSAGIEVILGAGGVIEDVVQGYISGTLVSEGTVCGGHDHHEGGSCH